MNDSLSEELLKDKDRLDWLTQVARTPTVYMNGQHPWNLAGNHKLRDLRGYSLRDAIDNARESKDERLGQTT